MAAYSDFDQIHSHLFQGSYPKLSKELLQQFDVIVYCSMERQPKPSDLRLVPPDKHVLSIPLDDNPYQPISRELAAMLIKLARQLATKVRAGRKTLITCTMGMNRSGLVTALTLMMATGCSGKNAVAAVRQHRRPASDGQQALFNPVFTRFVETLGPIG